MRPLLPLSLYCISLLALQNHALPVGNRLELMTWLHQLRKASPFPSYSELSDGPSGDQAVRLDKTAVWRALLLRNPTPSVEVSLSSLPVVESEEPMPRATRERRQAHPRINRHRSKGKLMRVGCIFGTCQMHELVDRLHKLNKQADRADAPMNPHSPHSYG